MKETRRGDKIGRFEIVELLGQGGMGEVFLCHDPKSSPRTPSQVAVKTVFPELLQDTEVLNRFNSEAKLLAPIRHPNVVQLYEWGRVEGSYFMAMEYINGTSLHILSRRRRLSFPSVLDLSIQIARGLHATHAAQVLHRDLKPANVMVTSQGQAKIIDFGIAKPTSMNTAEDDHADRGFKTKTGMVIGTVNYLAPEIIHGKHASVASDIYSLGLLIWEVLNGATPFKSGSLGETMKRIDDETLMWPEALIDLAPPGFIKFMSRLTAKDPSKRPSSAEAVAEELEKIAQVASWAGSLGRKTKFEFDIRWSEKTIESVKTRLVTETEIAYVLQDAEDWLIAQNDARINSTDAIDADDALIDACVERYKGNRYDAALARHERLKTELAGASGGAPTLPIPKNPFPTGGSGSRSFVSETETRRLVAGVLAVATTAIVATIAAYFYLRGGEADRQVASEVVTDRLTNSLVGTSVSLALEPGLILVYEIKTDGDPNVTYEQRTLTKVTPTTLSWVVNSATQVMTSRLIFPAEAFFAPIHRDPARAPVLRGQLDDFFPLVSGKLTRLEFIDKETDSIEDLRCTPMESRRETILYKEAVLWRVTCLRLVTKNDRLTHRISETYSFVPVSGLIVRAKLQIEEIDPSGKAIKTTSKRIGLDSTKSRIGDTTPVQNAAPEPTKERTP